MLVTSQLPIKLWHGQFQDPTLADAIRGRLAHNAQIIELTGESMRKKNQHTTLTEEDKPDPKIYRKYQPAAAAVLSQRDGSLKRVASQTRCSVE